ncbi:MAG: hypothetical protein AB1921_07520 [Thermodesulfobacteriota bacterium]
MAEKRYRAFFEGEILPGRDPETVRKDLARLLETDPQDTDRLFKGGRLLLSDGLAKDQALELKTSFARAGAFLVIESYEAEEETEEPPDEILADAIDLSAPEAAREDFFSTPPLEDESLPVPAVLEARPAEDADEVLLPPAVHPLLSLAPELAGPKSFVAPDIPLDLLKKALLGFFSEALDEETRFLADLSVSGNAGTGVLVSNTHLYVKDLYGPVLRIPLCDVTSMKIEAGRNAPLTVNGIMVLAHVPEPLRGPLAALGRFLSRVPESGGNAISDAIPESWIARREKVWRLPGAGIFSSADSFRSFLRNKVFLGRLADSEDNRMLQAMATGAAVTAFAFAVMASIALVRNAALLWGLSTLRMAVSYGLFFGVIAASFRFGIIGFLISAVLCAFFLLLLSGGGLSFTAMGVLMAVSPLLVGLAAAVGAALGASLGYVAWEFFTNRDSRS